MEAISILDWREKVVYSAASPQPQVLLENDQLRVVLVGLEPGQKLPSHAAPLGVYHFLNGSGWMHVDGQRRPAPPATSRRRRVSPSWPRE